MGVRTFLLLPVVSLVLGTLGFAVATQPLVDEYLQLPVKLQGNIESENLVKRQTNTNNEGGVSPTTIIIVCVVIFGGYFLILASIIGSLLFCFIRCGDNCSPRCSRKARVGCPKTVEDNVSVCCAYTARHLCPCCTNPNNWDSGELAFWIEIVILGILCLPFGLCLLILYALATSN